MPLFNTVYITPRPLPTSERYHSRLPIGTRPEEMQADLQNGKPSSYARLKTLLQIVGNALERESSALSNKFNRLFVLLCCGIASVVEFSLIGFRPDVRTELAMHHKVCPILAHILQTPGWKIANVQLHIITEFKMKRISLPSLAIRRSNISARLQAQSRRQIKNVPLKGQARETHSGRYQKGGAGM